MARTFLSVEGNNFKSFEHFKFDIQQGVHHIFGINEDEDYSVSNGAGKTSVVDALYWCMTGNTLKGIDSVDDVINLKKKKDCWVEVQIDVDGDLFAIRRHRKDTVNGDKIILTLAGDDSITSHKIADNQKKIQEILGVDFKLFKSVILMDNKLGGAFSTLTNRERVDLLESIRDYGFWDKVRVLAKKDLDALNNDILNLSSENATIEGQVSVLENQISHNIEEVKKYKETDYDNLIQGKNISLELQVDELNLSTNSLNKAKEQIEVFDKELGDIVHIANIDKTQLSTLEVDVVKLSQNIKELTNQIKEKKEVLNGYCPLCGSKRNLVESEIEVITNEIKHKMALLSESKEIYAEKLEEKGIISEKINSQSVQIDLKTKALKDCKSEESYYTSEVNKFQTEINNLNTDLAVLKANKDKSDEIIESIAKNIKTMKSDLANLQAKKEGNLEQVNKLKDQMSYVDFWYNALGPKGSFRPLMLARDIKYVNTKLKQYCRKLFSNMTVELSVPTADKREIDIILKTHSGLTKKMSMLSGGESKRVDLVIQFSLLSLLSMTASFQSNILFIDEVFESLDSEGISRVLELLQSLDIPSIYVISHNEILKSQITSQLKIVKSNDISKLYMN